MSFVRRLFGRKITQDEPTATPQDQVQPELESVAPLAPIQSGDDLSEPGLAKDGVAPIPGEEYVQGLPFSLDDTTQGLNELTSPVEGTDAQVAPQTKGLRVGYITDVGQVRDHNEDTLITFQGAQLGDDASDPFGFFVVTDGMGGHRAGEVASSLAARLVAHDVLTQVYVPFLRNETPGTDMAPLTEILRYAVQNANAQVHEKVPGAGTTLTCALILGKRAFIAHVGDSRAYLLTNYDIQQVTQDHSYVGRLIEIGELSPEEAAVHPQRHVLYRAIGQGDNLDIDTHHHFLPHGSRLLLCSDGLSGSVADEEISRIVGSAPTPQEACQYLVEAANAAGGPDNITALLIETPLD